jgi:DegV family protein with EDD domain
MGPVRIVTDSTADVPAALASDLGITVIPLQVHFGNEVYQNGVDVKPETFFEKLKQSSDLPQTSQPPVGRFVETYQKLLGEEGCEAIVSLHIAGSLSGTINAAWTASRMLPDPAEVEVIDSGQLSMGIGWTAIHAARVARTGATLAEVAAKVRSFLPRVRAAAMIDNLENLYRGGRITLLSAALGSMLQIKPLVSIQGGELLVWGKVRTRSKAMRQLEDHVREWDPLDQMAVLHTGAADRAQSLVSKLQDLVPADQMLILPAGPALTSHLALGAVGVAAVKSDPDAAVSVTGP